MKGIDIGKVLLFVAGACELIGALTVATNLSIGPVLAWVFGGLAAFFFAGVF